METREHRCNMEGTSITVYLLRRTGTEADAFRHTYLTYIMHTARSPLNSSASSAKVYVTNETPSRFCCISRYRARKF